MLTTSHVVACMPVRKKSARHQRIESEMHRVMAELVAREVKDPRVGHVTITAVEMLNDMSAARILFVPFAGLSSVPGVPTSGAQAALEVQAGLTRAAGFLRGEVGRRLSLRHAPRLEFKLDESIERAQRLTKLIDSAVNSDRSTRPPQEPNSDLDHG